MNNQINNIYELVEVVQNNKLTSAQVNILLMQCIGALYMGDTSAPDFGEKVIQFYEKHPRRSERPLFIGLSIGVLSE